MREWSRSHLVVLHPTGRVDQDDVEAVRLGVGDRLLGDARGVLAVALLVELDLALGGVELAEVADTTSQLGHAVR